MTRLKTPLISFRARGSLGPGLSFRESASGPVAEKKPIPAQPHSWPQTYQRWLYQDAGFYWQTLSIAQREAYRAPARKANNTLYGQFLADYLVNIPDVIAQYRMDEISSGQILDNSPNAHNAALFGPSLTPARIRDGLLFNGLDDYARAPYVSSWETPSAFTIETIFQSQEDGRAQILISRNFRHPWGLFKLETTNVLRVGVTFLDTTFIYQDGTIPLTIGTWFIAAVTYLSSSGNLRFYINGVLDVEPIIDTQLLEISSTPIDLGGIATAISWKGKQDHTSVYNRELRPAQIRAHAQRAGLLL